MKKADNRRQKEGEDGGHQCPMAAIGRNQQKRAEKGGKGRKRAEKGRKEWKWQTKKSAGR